jgi:iron complex outermembrane recepter protein
MLLEAYRISSIQQFHYLRQTLIVSALMLSVIFDAKAHTEDFEFDLPSQRLSTSLRAVAAQSGLQLFYQQSLIADHQSRPMSGRMNIKTALKHLLKNTGLAFEYADLHTIVIRKQATDTSTIANASSENFSSNIINTKHFTANSQALTNPENSALREQGTSALEEVIIIGTKRSLELQSTPMAVSTINSINLEKRFIRDLRDVPDLAPNLTVSTVVAFNAAAIAIRGQSTADIIASFDPAISVVVDDFSLAHVQSQLLDLFDIEQIEVLRGPQGTLFGKNTTGGVINIITTRPNLQENEIQLKATRGNYGLQEQRLAVNLPIIDEHLGLRLSAMNQRSDGFYVNDKPFGPLAVDGPFPGLAGVGDGERIGGADVLSARIKLLWKPIDKLNLLLQYEYIRDQSESIPLVNESLENFPITLAGFTPLGSDGYDDPFRTGFSLRDDGLKLADGNDIDIDGIYLNANYTTGSFLFTSITGYRELDSHLALSFAGEAFASFLDSNRDQHRDQFQQELRVTTQFDGPFNAVAGLFYTTNDFELSSLQYLGYYELFPDNEGAKDRAMLEGAAQDVTSKAIYFDGSYDLTERWSLTLGLRFTEEKKEMKRRPVSALELINNDLIALGLTPKKPTEYPFNYMDFDLFPVTDNSTLFQENDSWSKINYRAGVSYEISDGHFSYLMYSTGFKSGGFNSQAATASSARAFAEETAESIELGLKSDWFDGQGRTNIAVFHVNYGDIQRDAIVQIKREDGTPSQETQTTNAGGMQMYGVEIESRWFFKSDLSVSINLGYLHSKYTDFSVDINGDQVNDDGTILDPTRAPQWTAGLDMSYSQTLSHHGHLDWNLNANWQPEFEFDTLNSANTQSQERTLLNASTTWTSVNDRWSLSLYGKNLLDEQYRSTGKNGANLWIFTGYGAPLQYGAEVTVRF